jgi:hypothetical protein
MSEQSVDLARQKMAEFRDRFESLVVSDGQGHSRIETEPLLELVAAEPESVAVVCQAYAEITRHSAPEARGYAQLARVLASAYEVAFSDDTLTMWVEDFFGESATEVPGAIGLIPTDGPGARRPQYIVVDKRMLAEKDIYPFVTKFSHRTVGSTTGVEQLRSSRAGVWITFDIPLSDLREVWTIPEVREYVALLDERLPYLPYFFTSLPEAHALFTWFACLAPEDGLLDGPNGTNLVPGNENVLASVGSTINAVRALATHLGDDPDDVIDDLFVGWPRQYIEMVTAALREMAT